VLRMPWRERIGPLLRVARTEAGMKQEALAEAVGVAGLSISHYEGGRAVPKVDTLERIAAATGKPLAWFFQDEDEADPKPDPERALPDTHALLAQLVAAQVRAEERADQRHREMLDVLTALTHEQMQTRAEAAKMQRRLQQVESDLRETDEGEFSDCGEGEETRAG
jgi:transcriptional regulator with XRE-family HTH domain